MTDFLQLPSLKTLSTLYDDDIILVKAIGTITPSTCPSCRSSLYRHGYDLQTYNDSPHSRYKIIIEIARQRYRCKTCGKTIYEPLPCMHEQRRATARLIDYVQEKSISNSFASVADEVGMDEKTIREIFTNHVNRLDQEVHFETPETLGIDEVKLSGKFGCILTNIKKLTVFDLLPSCEKDFLLHYFNKLDNKKNIKVVTMDPSGTFKFVVKNQLPGRIIIADKFHVTKLANDALENVRRRLWRHLDIKIKTELKLDRYLLLNRKNSLSPEKTDSLERWLNNFPELKVAYEAKEQFYNLYEHPSRQIAEQDAKKWQSQLDPSIKSAFKMCSKTLSDWHDEIFNYYEYPVTNAYTESLNRLIKDIKRTGRGYNFETIRAKVLYNPSRKLTRKTLRKTIRRELPTIGLMSGLMSINNYTDSYETVIKEKVIEFGPKISTICDLIESGQIK